MQERYQGEDDNYNDPHRGAGPRPVHDGVEGRAAYVVLSGRWISGQGRHNEEGD